MSNFDPKTLASICGHNWFDFKQDVSGEIFCFIDIITVTVPLFFFWSIFHLYQFDRLTTTRLTWNDSWCTLHTQYRRKMSGRENEEKMGGKKKNKREKNVQVSKCKWLVCQPYHRWKFYGKQAILDTFPSPIPCFLYGKICPGKFLPPSEFERLYFIKKHVFVFTSFFILLSTHFPPFFLFFPPGILSFPFGKIHTLY